MKRTCILSGWMIIFITLGVTGFASAEGTRHITGNDIDLYFMNDKLFGHIKKHPLWAIYNCRSDIKGEIDVNGTCHRFNLRYHTEGDREITGSFGSHKIAMGAIKRTERGFVYQVIIGGNEYSFSVRYERLEKKHLVNSIIEGQIHDGEKTKMVVDGHLCPFATAGIIMVATGSIVESSAE